MQTTESNLMAEIKARTNLAGSNKLELLLFTLGEVNPNSNTKELFGINVFKVREVVPAPLITRVPTANPNSSIAGVVSIRGQIIPVVDLAKFLNFPESHPNILMITEYNNITTAYLVESVLHILRADWTDMHLPPDMLAGSGKGSITAVTKNADGELIMILDMEKVLSDLNGPDSILNSSHAIEKMDSPVNIYFIDDSAAARNQVKRMLEEMNISFQFATNGKSGLDYLMSLADQCEKEGVPVKSKVSLIITDAEMPEMDGYVFTKAIKGDRRFAGIPVLMHSSLSSAENERLGKSVGVDAYVPKFDAGVLSKTIFDTLNAKKGLST